MTKKSWIRMGALLLAGGLGAAPAGAATIKGKVELKGPAPKAKTVKVDAFPFCKAAHPNGIEIQSVEVNPNKTLKNVIVGVKSGFSGTPPAASPAPVDIVQKGCEYFPHVVAIQSGTPVNFKNEETGGPASIHNVHASPKVNKPFNQVELPSGVMKVDFSKPEGAFLVKCDIHAWMSAYVAVFEHPFFAVTGDDGSFELKNVPAGTYEIEAWQEKLGEKIEKVTVKGDETREVTFTFGGK